MPTARLACLAALVLSCAIPAGADTETLTDAQWREDLAALVTAVRDSHPAPFNAIAEGEFERRVQQLHDEIPGLPDHRIVVRLAELMAAIGDGHTRLTLPRLQGDVGVNFAHVRTPPIKIAGLAVDRLPVEVAWHDDGVFVVRATADESALLGARVLSVGERPVAEALEALRPAIHSDNEQGFRIFAADRLTVPEVLHAYGLALSPSSARFEFQLGNGERVSRDLNGIGAEPVAWRHVAPAWDSPPLWQRQPDMPFWSAYLPDHSAMYVQFNKATFNADHPVTRFVPAVLAEARRVKAQRLILDLRINHGGDATWNEPFLRAIIGHPQFDRHGSLFVLIGPRTFSAAQLLVNELEHHTYALFVGQPTGSGPASYGDAKRAQLPHSGLTLRVSTLHWSSWLAGEYRKEVPPHLPVSDRFADRRAGLDPTLDRALTYVPDVDPGKEFQRLLAVDVNHAALWVLRHSSDPANAERPLDGFLIEAGRRYLDAGDLDNARRAFQIGETLYSYSAETLAWLGVALERLGRTDDAIEAYRRSLARDPSTTRATEGLARLVPEPPPGTN